eukprot:gene17355-biopygen11937
MEWPSRAGGGVRSSNFSDGGEPAWPGSPPPRAPPPGERAHRRPRLRGHHFRNDDFSTTTVSFPTLAAAEAQPAREDPLEVRLAARRRSWLSSFRGIWETPVGTQERPRLRSGHDGRTPSALSPALPRGCGEEPKGLLGGGGCDASKGQGAVRFHEARYDSSSTLWNENYERDKRDEETAHRVERSEQDERSERGEMKPHPGERRRRAGAPPPPPPPPPSSPPSLPPPSPPSMPPSSPQ